VRTLIVGAALVLSVLVEQCGISLGDIDQFAINYKASVVNHNKLPTAVTIQVGDTSRSATLSRGQSVEVVSFKPGRWSVTIVDSEGRKAVLKDKIDAFRRELDALDPHSRSYDELADDIDDLEESLADVGNTIPGGSCGGEMTDPTGDEVSVNVEMAEDPTAGVRWQC
jgi:hypothetical protein